ncbi:TPA: transketolase [Candidatus Micrarchaeota archaeon]|nr:transketolase [Candidatus Micrarchaeota archaeon]
MKDIKQLKLRAVDLRMHVIRMVTQAQSGHVGGPLGLADIYACLYFNVMKHKPQKPEWEDRDRLILSNGHVCAIRYAAMAEAGYFPVQELSTFRKLGSRLQGHPSRVDLPGLETSNASLGQGLGLAIGKALACRLDNRKNFVFVSLSDGECEEGSTWEGAMFAAHHKVDNLIAFIDYNNIQIDGPLPEIMDVAPFAEKWRAFGWTVLQEDGNDVEKVLKAFKKAKGRTRKGKPVVIVFKTVPGKGVSFMENNFKWHGTPPKPEEGEKALQELSEWRKKIEESNFGILSGTKLSNENIREKSDRIDKLN